MKTLRLISRIVLTLILINLVFVLGTGKSRANQGQKSLIAADSTYSDLVVGVPGQDLPGSPSPIDQAGAIHWIRGYPTGLGSAGNQTFDQNMDWAEDQAETSDQFGTTLASGDFNGDGIYDLAVGVPFEDLLVGSTEVLGAGAVHVMYGSDTQGLSFVGDQFWHQASPGVEGSAEYNDQFGSALAVGNFNGDEFDDLAIGIPFEDFEYTTNVNNAGSVIVIYGSPAGLNPMGSVPNQMWHQDRIGIVDSVEDYDWFGRALAVGDFDDDGLDDLAIGAPGEDSEAAGKDDIGVVHVLYGTTDGLSADRSQQWEQFDWGGSAESESYDHFGWSLAAGDVKTSTGPDDLVIGVPDEDVDFDFTEVPDAGAVNILYGSSNGLTTINVDTITQGGAPVNDPPEYGDRFGYSLALIKFYPTVYDQLVIGVPYEDLGDPYVTDAGAVQVMNFFYNDWQPEIYTFFHQGRTNIPDELEPGDLFGYSIAAGDFNHDGKEDMAVGVPYDSCHTPGDGSVVVFYEPSISNPSIPPQRLCQGDGLVDEAETEDHFGLALVAVPSNDLTIFQQFLPIALGNP
jgi:hypothetical protein